MLSQAPAHPSVHYLLPPGALTGASTVAVADAQVVDGAVEQHRGPVEARPVRGPVALGVVTEQELADIYAKHSDSYGYTNISELEAYVKE